MVRSNSPVAHSHFTNTEILMHRFFSTYVHTPALSFTLLEVGSRTYVIVTACPSAPAMAKALLVFTREKGLLVADGATYAGFKPLAEDVDRVVCALQVGLAMLDSVASRVPVVKLANVAAMGFAWGEGARADPAD